MLTKSRDTETTPTITKTVSVEYLDGTSYAITLTNKLADMAQVFNGLGKHHYLWHHIRDGHWNDAMRQMLYHDSAFTDTGAIINLKQAKSIRAL